MNLSIKLLAITVLSPLSAPLFAQLNANATICIDAKNERLVHFNSNSDTTPGCADDSPQFLVEGGRSQLRVIHRKFLSDYSFTIDGSTQVVSERIQGLEEASTLTTPLSSATSAVSKGGAPKGLATSGTLSLRTAQQLLAELTDPTTSSNPANEIESDWIIVKEEIKRLDADTSGFGGTWMPLLGLSGASLELDCQSAYGNPTLVTAQNCITLRHSQENSGIWSDANKPFADEDAFRQLIISDTDAITMVTALQARLAAQGPPLNTQLTAIVGDFAQFSADISTLEGNLQAAHDAATLAQNLPESLQLAQIKQRLLNGLNGNKQVIDPTELNILSQELLAAARSPQMRALLAREAQNMLDRVAGITGGVCIFDAGRVPVGTSPSRCPVFLENSFRTDLTADSQSINVDLPARIDTINGLQSQLLGRTNQIYDNSAVDQALEKVITLGSLKGNLFVYYTIRRIDAFTRFQVPAVTVQGVAQGTSAGSLPPASAPAPSSTNSASSSGSPSTSTTTTTNSSSTTTTTVITPASSSSAAGTTGTVVAHGEIAIHDVFRTTVVAAFAFSSVKESPQSVMVETGTTSGSSPTACTVASPCSQVKAGPVHTSVVMGLMVHFRDFDTFPKAASLGSKFGVFGGLSVQNVNDYYAGLAFEPINGVQIMGGGNFYRQSQLAPGFTLNNIYTGSPTFIGRDGWSSGAYVGLGLNLRIFRKVFGSVTGVGTSATSSGGSSSSSGSSAGSS